MYFPSEYAGSHLLESVLALSRRSVLQDRHRPDLRRSGPILSMSRGSVSLLFYPLQVIRDKIGYPNENIYHLQDHPGRDLD